MCNAPSYWSDHRGGRLVGPRRVRVGLDTMPGERERGERVGETASEARAVAGWLHPSIPCRVPLPLPCGPHIIIPAGLVAKSISLYFFVRRHCVLSGKTPDLDHCVFLACEQYYAVAQ